MGEGMSKSTGYKHDDETLERLFWEFDDKRKGGGERLDFKNALRAYANSFYVAPDTEYQAEAAECAHMMLDEIGIPRIDPALGETFSLVGRLTLVVKERDKARAEYQNLDNYIASCLV